MPGGRERRVALVLMAGNSFGWWLRVKGQSQDAAVRWGDVCSAVAVVEREMMMMGRSFLTTLR